MNLYIQLSYQEQILSTWLQNVVVEMVLVEVIEVV